MRRAIFAGLALALLTASVASAQAPTDPARLFPREAPIELPATTGLVRLALPAAVLEGSRPDLSDVRIHDERGAARPYLVESATRRGGDATIYAITPTEVTTSARIWLPSATSAGERTRLPVEINSQAQNPFTTAAAALMPRPTAVDPISAGERIAFAAW